MILYGQIPEVAGKYQGKKLLVCASGRCLWDDLQQVESEDFDIMAINSAGLYLPWQITHWFSGYYESLGHLRKIRYYEYGDHFKPHEEIFTHSRFYYPGVDYVWKAEAYGFGTSTLDACSIGLHLGYDLVVIAGAPLDDSGHFYDPPWMKGEGLNDFTQFKIYLDQWEIVNKTFFHGRVKSLSGKTKEICGGYHEINKNARNQDAKSSKRNKNKNQSAGKDNGGSPDNGKNDHSKAISTEIHCGHLQKSDEERQVIHG